jgi:membrane protein DedA with SNARE-associated domain
MAALIQHFGNFFANLQAGTLPDLGYWNYLLFALFVIVEGPVVTVLAGAAASAGLLKPDLVFVAAGTANLTADALWYLFGFAFKREFLLRHGRRFGLRAVHLEKLQGNIKAHAFRLLFIAKITYGFAVPTIVAAGLSRLSWRRWFPPLVTAEVLWSGGLVLFGYYAGETFRQIEKDLRYLALFFAAAVLLLLIWWVRRVLSTRSEATHTLDCEFQEGGIF